MFLNHYAPVASVPALLLFRQIGWVGVDVFFVLSGFLITGILLDAKAERYYRNFYIRRSLRIFPLYFATITVVLAWMLIANDGEDYTSLIGTWGSPLWLYAFLGNVKTAVSGVAPPFVFVPLWSLHVEEQFYLIFPFVVRRLRRETLFKTLVVLVIAAPVIRCLLWSYDRTNPWLQYMLLPSRMDGLALGALIALRMRMGAWHVPKRALGAAGLLLLAASCAWFIAGGRIFSSPLERTLGYSLFSLAFAALVLWIVQFRGSWQTNWLNAAPLQFIGKISYGMYLLQVPTAILFAKLTRSLNLPRTVDETALGALSLYALCVVLASLSFYLFERPILRLKDTLAPTDGQRRPLALFAGQRRRFT